MRNQQWGIGKAGQFRLAALAAAFMLSGGISAIEIQAAPNILFIMSDDHASHALSCYSGKINQTPNLDRLAKEGMRFGHYEILEPLGEGGMVLPTAGDERSSAWR